MEEVEVLDIMEQGTSLSEEQIQKLKNNPDLMRACRKTLTWRSGWSSSTASMLSPHTASTDVHS